MKTPKLKSARFRPFDIRVEMKRAGVVLVTVTFDGYTFRRTIKGTVDFEVHRHCPAFDMDGPILPPHARSESLLLRVNR